MYSIMLRSGNIPDKMKQGEIITLHKGGRKSKGDPNNYRAITLSSSILKVYEMILLHRCKDKIVKTLSKLQGGFQDQLGCVMTSFTLRECLHHSRELSSGVYLCFLDARQAFDRVWHDGLFYKLLNINTSTSGETRTTIDSNTLTAFREMYRNATSRVRYQGMFSEPFPV